MTISRLERLKGTQLTRNFIQKSFKKQNFTFYFLHNRQSKLPIWFPFKSLPKHPTKIRLNSIFYMQIKISKRERKTCEKPFFRYIFFLWLFVNAINATKNINKTHKFHSASNKKQIHHITSSFIHSRKHMFCFKLDLSVFCCFFVSDERCFLEDGEEFH